MKLKVMTIFGTRPEAIKMAPLVKELEKNNQINSIVCVTAQHRQMLDQVLNIFKITPDYDLNIMKARQTLADITVKTLQGLNSILDEVLPDIILVHGDTTTTFVGSLAAFYKKISVGHVEAGLRTYDKYSPYPEEMNRRLTGVLSDLHFAPTVANRKNLLNEGVGDDSIFVTGNTVIDALKTTVTESYSFSDKTLASLNYKDYKIITVTAHRRENLGKPLFSICEALLEITNRYKDIIVVYPVHLNPVVQETAHKVLGNHDRIHLINPLDVQDMHNLMARSYIILTDSGGLQEEAPSLGKPVVVLRNETERPEAVSAGSVKLAGTDKNTICTLASQLIESDEEYVRMAKSINPYGDGNASKRIVEALLYKYGNCSKCPEEFAPGDYCNYK